MTSPDGDSGPPTLADPYTGPSGGLLVTRNAQTVLTANTAQYQQQMGAAASSTAAVTGAVGGLLTKLDDLFKGAGRKLEIVGKSDAALLTAAVGDAAALQKQLQPLAATAAVTNTSMSGMAKAVDTTYTSMRQARGEVVALVNQISNLGVANRNIGALTQTVMKFQLASGQSGLAQPLIGYARQFGVSSPRQIAGYANSALSVARNAGVDPGGVLNFAQSIAPLARQRGIGATATLGISTAFSRAGADGFVAANLFNSIVNDITQKVRTGDPGISQYSSLTGTRPGQFARMPGTQQVVSVFQALSRGGPRALDFVNSQGIGIRGLSALQAVAQGGGLQGYISQAESSAGNTKNLDKGAAAAVGGFTNALAGVRNEFSRMGELIGGPVLAPLTALAHGFESFLHLVNNVVQALGPLPAILAAVAAVALPVAGAVVAHATGLGGLFLAKSLLSPNGGKAAFADGREVRGLMASGMSREDAIAATRTGGLIAAGGMPLRARVPFYAAMGMPGGTSAAAAEDYQPRHGLPVGYQPRHGLPVAEAYVDPSRVAAASAYAEQTVAAETADAAGRPGLIRRMGAYAVRGATMPIAAMYNGSRSVAYDARQTDPYAKRPYSAGGAAAGGAGAEEQTMRARLGAWRAETEQTLSTSGMIGVAGKSFGAVAKAGAGLAAETVKTSASLAAQGVGMAGRAGAGGFYGVLGRADRALGTPAAPGAIGTIEGGARQLAGGIGAVAGGVGGLLKGAGSALFSPMGMMAAFVGIPLLQGLFSHVDAGAAKSDANAIGSALNPLSSYNDALGVATQHLASFSNALTTATTASTPGTQSSATNFRQARSISTLDVASYANKGSNDANLGALKAYMGTGKQAVSRGRALINAMGIQSYGQLDLFKQNMLGAGIPRPIAQQILNGFKPGAMGDPAQLAGLINASEGADYGVGVTSFGLNPSSSGATLQGAVLGRYMTREQSDLQGHSPRYAAARYLQAGLPFLAQEVSGAAGKGQAAFGAAQNAMQVFGGLTPDQLVGLLPMNADGSIDPSWNKRSEASKERYLADALYRAGATQLFTGGLKPSDVGSLGSIIAGATSNNSTQVNSIQSTFGPLGRFATLNPSVAHAEGDKNSDPAYVAAAAQRLAEQAASAAGGLSGATGALNRLGDSLGGANTASGRLMQQAAQWARTLQGFNLPYMSRAGQLGVYASNLTASRTAAQAPGATQTTVDQYHSDLGSYEQQKASYQQYMISVQEQATQFDTQMTRSERDFDTQRMRNKREYYIQMSQMQQDYETSVARNELQYQRSTFRAEQDYNTQRAHSLQDFAISQRRALEQSVETIYNPFASIQPETVASGGDTIDNLRAQNRSINRQHRQLVDLKKEGLKQSTIDALQLADPKNAQQLNELADQIANDPKLIARINGLVSERAKATAKLTQSTFNETYRNTVDDFTRQMRRTSDEFHRAQDRAATDEATTLDQMATDHQRAIDRAALAEHNALHDMTQDYTRSVRDAVKDLRTAMTELYGSFASEYGNTLAAINDKIGKYAPALARTLIRELGKANAAIQSVENGTMGSGTGGAGGGGGFGGAGGGRGSALQRTARSWLGTPYVWDGSSRAGVDCSGLVMRIYAAYGVNLPHSAAQQDTAKFGSKVSNNMSDWNVGDLLFYHFDSDGPGIGHVGMYMGNGMMIEAAQQGVPVHIVPVYRGGLVDVRRPYGESRIDGLGTGDQTAGGSRSANGAENGPPINGNAAGSVPFPGGAGTISGQPAGVLNGSTPIHAQKGTGANPVYRAGARGVVAYGPHRGQFGSFGPGGKFRRGHASPEQLANGQRIADPRLGRADSPEGAKAFARSRLSAFGWNTNADWVDLDWLWGKESSWSNTADTRKTGLDPRNASTFAFGISQARNYTKLPKAGWPTDKGGQANGEAQIDWGLDYIRHRYGSIRKAVKHEVDHGWYAAGSVFTQPRVIGVGEAGPEAVIPLNERGEKFVAPMLEGALSSVVKQMGTLPFASRACGDVHVTYNQDYRTQFTGDITVKADNAATLIAELQRKTRSARLIGLHNVG